MALSTLELESLIQKKQMIENYLESLSEKINQRLDALIAIEDKDYAVLFNAVRYSLLSNGKRLRPLLTIVACDVFGVAFDKSIDPACCIEMIHTYSLIHDDLPSMDNDNYRRGKPTLHIAYSEAIAILAGDMLLTYPFEILANLQNVAAEKKNKLISTLAKRSGKNEMIAGQVIDLISEGKSLNQELMEKMHRKKTASMFCVCFEFAAILGDANDIETKILQEIGQIIGLAFQIQDDILDLTLTTKELGKPAKSDLINGKSTSVSCLGIDNSLLYITALKEKALQLLKKLNRKTFSLEKLILKFISKVN
jgi:geranylgeranyl diphosphate synthase, type II